MGQALAKKMKSEDSAIFASTASGSAKTNGLVVIAAVTCRQYPHFQTSLSSTIFRLPMELHCQTIILITNKKAMFTGAAKYKLFSTIILTSKVFKMRLL